MKRHSISTAETRELVSWNTKTNLVQFRLQTRGGRHNPTRAAGHWRSKSMTVYVTEINGRAIAAFNAENEIQAEVRATSKPFRADLTVLENEGHPLWNGRDEIFIRKALPAEEAQFDASQARAIKDKDDDWLMFLVPVTDPTDDFDP